MKVRSGFEVCGQLPPFSQNVIREEENFVGSVEQARREGGPITRAFVDALPPDLATGEAQIMTLMHWFKQGWSARGEDFHFDGVEPDPAAEQVRNQLLAYVGVNPTEFIVGELDLPALAEGLPRGPLVHHEIMRQLDEGRVSRRTPPEGAVVRFGNRDYHSAAFAATSGWRVLVRLFPRSLWWKPGNHYRQIQNDYNPFNGLRPLSEARLYAPYVGLGGE